MLGGSEGGGWPEERTPDVDTEMTRGLLEFHSLPLDSGGILGSNTGC